MASRKRKPTDDAPTQRPIRGTEERAADYQARLAAYTRARNAAIRSTATEEPTP